MDISQSEIEGQISQLSTRAFDALGEDLACMLGVQISGNQTDSRIVALSDLKKQFKKLVAVGTIHAEGLIDGCAFTLLDQEGFFTLAGTLVVQPEKVILQNRKFGNNDTAQEISDAIGEVGNLLVGSFDRIFREECPGHGHFVYTKTFVGSPWSKIPEVFGIAEDSKVLQVSYEMVVNEFPPFSYSIIYPIQILAQHPAQAQTPEPPMEAISQQQPTPEPAAVEPIETAVQTQPPAVVTETKSAASVFESIQKITNSPAALPGQFPQSPLQSFRNVPVGQITQKQIAWAGPDDTVEQVLAKMQQFAADYVLVGANQVAQGIVSRSDVRGAMSPYLLPMFAQYKRPLDLATLQIRIKWVMTTPVHTIRDDSSVSDAVNELCSKKIRALAVIDKQGTSIGMITSSEIMAFLSSLI